MISGERSLAHGRQMILEITTKANQAQEQHPSDFRNRKEPQTAVCHYRHAEMEFLEESL